MSMASSLMSQETAELRNTVSTVLSGLGALEIDGPPVSTFSVIDGVDRDYFCHSVGAGEADLVILSNDLLGRLAAHIAHEGTGTTIVWRQRPELAARGKRRMLYARFGILAPNEKLDHLTPPANLE